MDEQQLFQEWKESMTFMGEAMKEVFESRPWEDQLVFALRWYVSHIGDCEGIDYLGAWVPEDERWIADFIKGVVEEA